MSTDKSESLPGNTDCQRGPCPQPFFFRAFALATLTAAMSDLRDWMDQIARQDARRRNAKARNAAILEWEAALRETKDRLRQSETMVEDRPLGAAGATRGRLRPRSSAEALTTAERSRLRGMGRRLLEGTRKMKKAASDLQAEEFLSEPLAVLQRRLEALQITDSLADFVTQSNEAIDALIPVGEYLRKAGR